MKYTDFRQFSHAELRAMVQALNPGEVMAAADPWRRAADTLKAIRTTLTRASTEAATSWEGTTSDAFHTRMLHLATTINTAASYANDAAITLKAVSEAIAEAKRNMPEEPSGWAQFKDGVGDTFSSLFGADDEDARTDLANQKKAEAATVLQTLAMHYRTAAPMLKPPPPPGASKGWNDGEYTENPAGDAGATGYAAVGGFLGGASAGNVGTGTGSVARAQQPSVQAPRTGAAGRSDSSVASTSFSKSSPVPADPGVKGGVAAPPSKPGPVGYGAGAVMDGTAPELGHMSSGQSSSGTGGTSILGTSGNGGSQAMTTGPTVQSSGLQGGGGGTHHPSAVPHPFTSAGSQGPGEVTGRGRQAGPDSARAGRDAVQGRTAGARSGASFGAEGIPGTVGGGAARRKATSEGAAGHASGTVVGVGDRAGRSGAGKQAFTEGGSGLGARGRIRPETGVGNSPTQAPLVPLGSAGQGRKDDEKRRRRPDYLVEDEETWESDEPVNPNVVE
ncbi:hypothetical protein [Kitasatospora purpeofusca]|uniref:WXG100 family type VII secretion target n=1 Tax=Kitasatospora purpeofusca TaxID=67352 RepID=UPI002A5A2D47|nr:hypothetical protein [Kitasatospora purpeofusca]MDY0810242.1 hypothetical protein [Kitasatospora purpeofusca]